MTQLKCIDNLTITVMCGLLKTLKDVLIQKCKVVIIKRPCVVVLGSPLPFPDERSDTG